MEQKKKGGKRIGAGRKKTDNPKKAITFYVKRSDIFKFRTEEKLKGKLLEFIEKGDLSTEIQFAHTQASFDSPKLPDNYFSDEPKQLETTPVDLFAFYQAKIAATTYSEDLSAVMREIHANKELGKIIKNNLDFFSQQHRTTFTY